MPNIPYVLKNYNFRFQNVEHFNQLCNINNIYKCPYNKKCLVKWNESSQLFVCQCHGCNFELNGNRISGMAKTNIKCD